MYRYRSHSITPSRNYRSANPDGGKSSNPYEKVFFEELNDFILLQAVDDREAETRFVTYYTVVSLNPIIQKNRYGERRRGYPALQFRDNQWSYEEDRVTFSPSDLGKAQDGLLRSKPVNFDVLGEKGRLTVLDFVAHVRRELREEDENKKSSIYKVPRVTGER